MQAKAATMEPLRKGHHEIYRGWPYLRGRFVKIAHLGHTRDGGPVTMRGSTVGPKFAFQTCAPPPIRCSFIYGVDFPIVDHEIEDRDGRYWMHNYYLMQCQDGQATGLMHGKGAKIPTSQKPEVIHVQLWVVKCPTHNILAL